MCGARPSEGGHHLSDHGDSTKRYGGTGREDQSWPKGISLNSMSLDRKTKSQENGDKSVWTPTNGVYIVWA